MRKNTFLEITGYRFFLGSFVWRAIVGLVSSSLFFQARADNIAFFYALDADAQAFKAEVGTTRKPLRVGTRSIYVCQVGPHSVYLTKMGSGAVETAASAQALLAKVRCDFGVSIGPVGALSDDLQPGDWHLVSSIIPYQKGAWAAHGLLSSDRFSIDPAQPRLTPPNEWRIHLPIVVASGEIFVASSDYRAQLRQLTKADAVDMNLFGLVSVCSDHQLPTLHVRIVSDRADDHASEHFRDFTKKYDGRGGKALLETIKKLPPNPNSPEAYPNLQKLLRDPPQK